MERECSKTRLEMCTVECGSMDDITERESKRHYTMNVLCSHTSIF